MGKTVLRLVGMLLALAALAGASAATWPIDGEPGGWSQQAPPAGTVTVGLDPASLAVLPEKTFLMDIVVDARSQEVNGAEVHLDFDPDYLSVVDEAGELASEIRNGVALPFQIENTVDNSLGEIHYAAGKVSPGALQIPFVLASIRFRAEELVSRTEVTFRVEGDRPTKVTMDYTLIPIHTITDGAVRVFVYRFYLPLAMRQ
jgi:hypothetical protein